MNFNKIFKRVGIRYECNFYTILCKNYTFCTKTKLAQFLYKYFFTQYINKIQTFRNHNFILARNLEAKKTFFKNTNILNQIINLNIYQK